MNFKNFFFFFLLSASFLSCRKDCDYPADTTSGDIISGSTIKGFDTGGIKYVYTQGSPSDAVTISFDNSMTYEDIDYSKYSVINFPFSVGCNTRFDREVIVDHTIHKVVYTINYESCPDCEEDYFVENWILVKAFPSTYTVVYDRNKI